MSLGDPIPSFRFVIEIDGIREGWFSKCTGLTVKRDTTSLEEGGENSYVHQLPGRISYENIVLEHGVFASHTELWDWFGGKSTSSNPFKVNRRMITIYLYGFSSELVLFGIPFVASPKPVRTWTFRDAYPVEWTGPELDTGTNEVAIEKLTIAHHGLLSFL